MTTPLASVTGGPDLAVREPTQVEVERVLYLFGKAAFPAEARFLVAVRARPIERFVAAVAWWPAGTIGLLRLACRPGANGGLVAGSLIERAAEFALQAGVQTLQYAESLPAGHEWVDLLRGQGFEKLRSERFFEVPARNVYRRITQLYERHHGEIPAGWRTDPIRLHPPEVILDLIAPHRLLPPPEVRQAWQANAAMGFDLDLSCILFDRERAFGTLLSRRKDDLLHVDVQVVDEPNPRLRSLGDLCLIYHDALRVTEEGPIHSIQFRSGETEHRQTANLALRMGGRELATRHVFGRSLAAVRHEV